MDEFEEWYLRRFEPLKVVRYWQDLALPFMREYLFVMMAISGVMKVCGITPVSLMAEGTFAHAIMSSAIILGCLLMGCEMLLKPLVKLEG